MACYCISEGNIDCIIYYLPTGWLIGDFLFYFYASVTFMTCFLDEKKALIQTAVESYCSYVSNMLVIASCFSSGARNVNVIFSGEQKSYETIFLYIFIFIHFDRCQTLKKRRFHLLVIDLS